MAGLNGILPLQNLARAYGIETEYRDNTGHRQESSPESLLAVLRAFGAPLQTEAEIPDARRQWRRDYWRRCLEPVVVAWDGACPPIDLRLPAGQGQRVVRCELTLEPGEVRRWDVDLAAGPPLEEAVVEGERYTAGAISLREHLPAGYHRLSVEVAGTLARTMIMAAPVKACSPSSGTGDRTWGAFLPLHALQSQRSWGAGDFSDLEAFMEWVAGLGGRIVGTLPLLSSFLDRPCDPSPYTPVSRLFWNEMYLDVARVPEMASCPEARDMAGSDSFRGEVESLNGQRLVDYRRVMALKRTVLEKLAMTLTPGSGGRYEAFRAFLAERGDVPDYARFRAAVEARGGPWPGWPEAQRGGVLRPGDFAAGAEHYHAYVQWLAEQQLQEVSDRSRGRGISLYLDLPLGVHRDGYDTWREQGLFVREVCSGAPPDALFHKGQNWGFPPLHPQRVREQGYRYPIAYLRHHMKYADILRVDHVMGLHHLYWVPDGMPATRGVYVRYPADEMYAILSVESHRHRCAIAGENLGTVPEYVNEAMAHHGVSGLYVVQYEVPSDANAAPADPPPASVASLNTHDMPPFAAFWQGLEIGRWQALGLVTEAEARERMEERHMAKRNLVRFLERSGYLQGDREDIGRIFRACLSFLNRSQSRTLLVNMEDLWLETEQQNVPGVVDGHPNWQRKARYNLDTFSRMPEVLELLRSVTRSPATERGDGA